jgi:hypothetical protein
LVEVGLLLAGQAALCGLAHAVAPPTVGLRTVNAFTTVEVEVEVEGGVAVERYEYAYQTVVCEGWAYDPLIGSVSFGFGSGSSGFSEHFFGPSGSSGYDSPAPAAAAGAAAVFALRALFLLSLAAYAVAAIRSVQNTTRIRLNLPTYLTTYLPTNQPTYCHQPTVAAISAAAKTGLMWAGDETFNAHALAAALLCMQVSTLLLQDRPNEDTLTQGSCGVQAALPLLVFGAHAPATTQVQVTLLLL